MKYRFINEHRHQYAITTLCRVLQVARAGFYQWLHKPVSAREYDNARLLGLIRDSYAASRGVYGARRVFADLREAGETCGKHRVARLMRVHKIKALRGYKAPRPIKGRPSIIAPNHLNRTFTVDAPNKVWVTDITYIRTARLVVLGCRAGSLCAQGSRLVNETDASQGVGVGCFADGHVASQAQTPSARPLRPRQSIWQR